MTASSVRCASCGSEYVVPASLVSDDFEKQRLIDWTTSHECSSELIHKGRSA